MAVKVRQKSVVANARVSATTGQAIKNEAKRLGFKYGSFLAVVITRYAAMLTSEDQRAVRLYRRAMAAICDAQPLPGVPRVIVLTESDLAKAQDMDMDPVWLLDQANVVMVAASSDAQETMPLIEFVRVVMAGLEQ